jgi:outer membrane protein OmpA-like peptidoglycan-associated protein
MKYTRIPSGLFLIPLFFFGACTAFQQVEVPDYPNVACNNLGAEVNSKSDDFAPTFSGNRMIFTSNRQTVEGYLQGDDFWFCDNERGAWSQALNFGGKINTTKDEGSPFVSPDGETIYFAQCWTADGLGDADLYSATLDSKGSWQNIRNLGEIVNSKAWDSQPFVSPDGEQLFFASDRPGGYGGTDIWVSHRLRNDKWGKPVNLGPNVNTSGDEKAPMMAPNGVDLYFSSNGLRGLGGFDFFVTHELKNKTWVKPINIGRPFNSADDDLFFRLSSQEDTVFISSSRSGGLGGLDIYSIGPNPFKDTTRYKFYAVAVVFDSITNMLLPNAYVTVRNSSGKVLFDSVKSNGRFRFEVKPKQSYSISASAEKYLPVTDKFTVPVSMYNNEYRRNIALTMRPAQRSAKDTARTESTVPVAYFDFDKYELRPDGEIVLDRFFVEKIQPLLKGETDFEIILDAYTDSVGTVAYNYNLSRQRGAVVSAYLKTRGTPLSSIVVNAHGETLPAQSNETEAGRQRNRRVEIRLGTNK